MGYDSEKHHRRSTRLKGYDYSQPGAYFITICSWQRQPLFDRTELLIRDYILHNPLQPEMLQGKDLDDDLWDEVMKRFILGDADET